MLIEQENYITQIFANVPPRGGGQPTSIVVFQNSPAPWSSSNPIEALSLANSCFAHDSSVFPVLLRTPVRAPKANAYCERLVGSTRRECLDFMIPLGEKHLRRILAEWVTHYNQGRPHLSLGPGIPEPAAVFLPRQGHDRHSFAQDCKVVARAVLGGLHHEYRWESIAA